ncbi:MAG: hypothetical protein Q7T87_04245 [Polaromonas sp.]|nr:hypothetical protein [Polaromonas sp.]
MTIHQMLHTCSSTADVQSALRTICSRFGSLHRLDVIATSPRKGRQAMCFLRMASPSQENQLIEHIGPHHGVGRFGGDVVLVVDLQGAPPATAPEAPGGFADTSSPDHLLHEPLKG